MRTSAGLRCLRRQTDRDTARARRVITKPTCDYNDPTMYSALLCQFAARSPGSTPGRSSRRFTRAVLRAQLLPRILFAVTGGLHDHDIRCGTAG
jgi:hypothetical protein